MAEFHITKNRNFHAARAAKNDEFYTREEDIAQELYFYRRHFGDKIIYCNCDDPTKSAFFQYFKKNFNHIGIKRLITTCYKNQNASLFTQHDSDKAVCLIYDGSDADNNLPTDEEIIEKCSRNLKGDGDFRSEECVELLKEANIVVTNPPFSLFREYLLQLVEFEKKFIIVGPMGGVQYKSVFPLFRENKIWIGYKPMGSDMLFDVTEDYAKHLVQNKKEGSGYRNLDGGIKGRASAIWYTNLEHNKRNEDLRLWKKYTPKDFPKYDNFDAIEVPRVSDIPLEYKGLMGVPITFLDKYSPTQFQIIGTARELTKNAHGKSSQFFLNGKELYTRIVIRRI